MLSIIEPPYSSEFTAVFLPLLQNKEIAESLVVEGRQDPVSQFMGVWVWFTCGCGGTVYCESEMILFFIPSLAECPKKSKKKNKRSARNH